MAKILVTGGAGYIGSTTAHRLRAHGFDVVIVDDLSRGHESNVAGFPFHKLNTAQTSELIPLLADVDAVVHFAAYIAVGESTQKPELYFSNNVNGSLGLLTAMLEAGVKRLVFSSTAAVYGLPEPSTISSGITEATPLAPVNPYGESKVMVEKMLGWLDQYRGLRSIALRYFNACGADPETELGEDHEPETHLIPLLFRAVRTGQPVTLFGHDYDTPDGTCIRDYIHIVDLAEAHIVALDRLLAGGGSDSFNVGSGAGHSVMEVVQAVEQVTGSVVPRRFGPRREGDPPVLVANSDKLKGVLSWKPRYADLRDIVETAWRFEQTRHPAGDRAALGGRGSAQVCLD
jgi:UDP-glucose 4-epimerase